jgi:hypothetical protein
MYKYTSAKSQNFKELVDGVWLYSNFIENCKDKLLLLSEEIKECINQFETKEFEKYKNIIIESLSGKDILTVENIDKVVVRSIDQDVPVHVDVVNWENKIRDKEIEKQINSITKHFSVYGYVIYLNDNYDGGEIFYPEFNFAYKPKPGDLIVHDVNIPHGVKKILAGKRVSIAGTIGKDFYFSPEVYALADEPNEQFNDKDPRYFFSEHQGESSHPRLKKYMEGIKRG